jgi:integrase
MQILLAGDSVESVNLMPEPTDDLFISRWKRNSKRDLSWNSRLKILQKFLDFHKISASQLIMQARKYHQGERPDEIEEMLTHYLDARDAAGNASSTLAKEAGAISGFLGANYVTIKLPAKYKLTPQYESTRLLTQKEVGEMIHVTKQLEAKAVICILAQTGQRIGILPCLRFDMINRYQQNGRVYGVIEVMPDISDRKGRPSGNKSGVQYKFGLHWQSLQLLDKMKARSPNKKGWIWNLDKRRMQEVIGKAAKKAKIQKVRLRKLPKKDNQGNIVGYKKWYEIKPHIFRSFWKDRMREARVDTELQHAMMGHPIPSGGTYDRGLLRDQKIVDAINQADNQLQVLP